MLSYISKEMVYPILPLYLVNTLGLTPYFIGLIEGISKSLASILKFYSGYLSDMKKERKKLVIIGYMGAFLHKVILLIGNSWFFVLLAKLFERFGKGIRVAPKDALLADASKSKKYGQAFGLQRAFDKLGAVIGIIISYILVIKIIDIDYKLIFFISAIPILVGIILLFFIKQEKVRGTFLIDLKNFSSQMKLYFFIVFFSSLGNSTKSYLLLKATANGVSSSMVIIFYLLANLTTCLVAYPIGKYCDKFNKSTILALAYFVFAITYLGLAIFSSPLIIAMLFILYGIFIALISVGSKAFIIENITADMRATAFGINECLVGLATLPASIIAGILWTTFNPNISFYFSFIIAFVSSLLVLLLKSKKKSQSVTGINMS